MSDESQVGMTEAGGTPAVETERTLGELHEPVAVTSPVNEEAIAAVEAADVGQDVSDFASALHTYLQQNVTWADTKAAFLFAASGGVLAYLHGQGLTKRIMPHLFEVPNKLSNTVGMIAVAGFLVSACAAFATFWPRTGGDAEGIVFWKAIATKFKSGHLYAESVLDRDPRALAEAKLHHCWELARVCGRKFKWANVATYGAAVGAVATVIYLAEWMR